MLSTKQDMMAMVVVMVGVSKLPRQHVTTYFSCPLFLLKVLELSLQGLQGGCHAATDHRSLTRKEKRKVCEPIEGMASYPQVWLVRCSAIWKDPTLFLLYRHSASHPGPLVDSGVTAILAWLCLFTTRDPSWYLDIKDRFIPERSFVSRLA